MILAVMACWYVAGWMPQNTQCTTTFDVENQYVTAESCQMRMEDIVENFDPRFKKLMIQDQTPLHAWFACFEDGVNKKDIPGLMMRQFNPVKVDS